MENKTYNGYEGFNFETAANALAEIRRQHLAGEPLVWTGPDRLHHSISAGCPPPSDVFSPEGLEYDAEHGRDFWDSYTMIAFQLGFHNGVINEGQNTNFYKRMSDSWKLMRREVSDD